jgi:CBS domain-containing protein
MKIYYKGFMREKIQKNPVTITPEASFFEARNLIHEKGIRHLPVVDKNNSLVGIVTDRDIREAAFRCHPPQRPGTKLSFGKA